MEPLVLNERDGVAPGGFVFVHLLEHRIHEVNENHYLSNGKSLTNAFVLIWKHMVQMLKGYCSIKFLQRLLRCV